jgi:tRNA synthetases class II (A)
MIDADSLRSMFLAFFAERGHVIVPSASLIPDGDPSVLFTTAGVHSLLPYLLGRPHPAGKLLADCQKCLRTTDVDEVGDSTHLTFFEMLGNWSLGAYFKGESITWSHEPLTRDDLLAIPSQRLWTSHPRFLAIAATGTSGSLRGACAVDEQAQAGEPDGGGLGVGGQQLAGHLPGVLVHVGQRPERPHVHVPVQQHRGQRAGGHRQCGQPAAGPGPNYLPLKKSRPRWRLSCGNAGRRGPVRG